MKKWKSLAAIALTVSVASGCSYQAPVSTSAAYNVYSSYEEKVPGKWAIYIDGSEFKDGNLRPSSHMCSAHTYPVDSSSVFERSALKTFANLVDSIERIETPIAAEQLEEFGFDGQIIIKSEDMDIDLIFISNLFSADAEAETEFEASLTAYLQKSGKVLGTTTDGEGEERLDGGAFCDKGAIVVGSSVEEAMKELLQRLGEKFASSSRIRDGLTSNKEL